MSVGDWVIRQAETFVGSTLGSPLLGRVIAEAAGPPATAHVVWQNGDESAAYLQSSLLRVFDPGAVSIENAENVAKWVQLGFYPVREVDAGVVEETGDPPKSPAAAGLVVRAYGVGGYGAGAPSTEQFVMSTYDGRLFMNMELPVTAGTEEVLTVTREDGRRRV